MRSLNLKSKDLENGVCLWHVNIKQPMYVWKVAGADEFLCVQLHNDHIEHITLSEINSSMVLEIMSPERLKSWVHRERESRTRNRDRALDQFYTAEKELRALESACMMAHRYFERQDA